MNKYIQGPKYKFGAFQTKFCNKCNVSHLATAYMQHLNAHIIQNSLQQAVETSGVIFVQNLHQIKFNHNVAFIKT